MHELELDFCSFGFNEASQTRQLFKAALYVPIPTALPFFLCKKESERKAEEVNS